MDLSADMVVMWRLKIIRNKLGIDDSLDVFAVHGVGGILGSLLVSVLATASLSGVGLPDGVSISDQFIVQLCSVSLAVGWTGIISFIILKVIQATSGIRISDQDDIEGFDLTQHGERCIPLYRIAIVAFKQNKRRLNYKRLFYIGALHSAISSGRV